MGIMHGYAEVDRAVRHFASSRFVRFVQFIEYNKTIILLDDAKYGLFLARSAYGVVG